MSHSIRQSCLIIVTFLFPFCKLVEERLKIDDKFSISIPSKYEENKEVLEIIQKTNSDVIALYQLDHSDLPKTLMSISSYSSSQPMSLDSAFYNETVGAVSNNIGTMSEDYKLISYEAYYKNGMKLYRKVSSPIEGKCAVMYYLMEGEFSNKLYEIKVVGDLGHQHLLIEVAEEIVLTVKIV